MVQQSRSAVYAFGLVRADDVPTAPLTYTPLAKIACPVCESTDCLCAPERWDADERAEWAAAEMRDEMAERGYW